MRGVIAVLCASAALAAGCGGEERTAFAAALATLCEEARVDIEALGLPAEQGFKVMVPWAERGRGLAKDVEALAGGTAEERELRGSFSRSLASYYESLQLAARIYETSGSAEAYGVAAERATPYLESAEALAVQLGAPECAVRPFADVDAPS